METLHPPFATGCSLPPRTTQPALIADPVHSTSFPWENNNFAFACLFVLFTVSVTVLLFQLGFPAPLFRLRTQLMLIILNMTCEVITEIASGKLKNCSKRDKKLDGVTLRSGERSESPYHLVPCMRLVRPNLAICLYTQQVSLPKFLKHKDANTPSPSFRQA